MPLIAGGRKIRAPIQAPLRTPPSHYTFCGHNNNNARYSQRNVTPETNVVNPAPSSPPPPPPPSPTPVVTRSQSPQSQPPLITDTLTACLDVNGTYICTSYSPRCYIIQKVTPNSLKVSPSPAFHNFSPGCHGRGHGQVIGEEDGNNCDDETEKETGHGHMKKKKENNYMSCEVGVGESDQEQCGTSSTAGPPKEESMGVELRQQVQAQLEYYFSPDNLSTDKFLVSQMDSDQYVDIATIANFNMIKKLSSDLDLITDVLRESKSVQVHPDGKRVRPISNRTIVILRGIPEHTPIEEIKALFEKENSPRCNHCEFAFNDSWYLSFDSDDDAMRAHRYLREEVRQFKGQPIMARIKSRPTTLLGPGVGVNPQKNGYQQPQFSIPAYITAPYVPVSTTGPQPPNNSNTTLYPTPQQVSSAVFTMRPPAYGSFGATLPWAPNFYELNSSLQPIYMNGLPTGAPYTKSAPPQQMIQRHRTSKSESSESFHPPLPRGPRRSGPGAGGDNMLNEVGGYHNNSRKSSSHPPTPLLSIPPKTHLQPSTNSKSTRNNGHLNYSSLPSHSVPNHNSHESFNRTYQKNDNRPRSSLGVRRGGGNVRGHDDEGGFNSGRRIPSAASRSGVSEPPSSPVQSNDSQIAPQPRNTFDLQVSSFPPLPGALTTTTTNGNAESPIAEGSQSQPPKKEYREVGVGSSDAKHDIKPSTSCKEVANGGKVKETADKSTQSVLVKTTSTSTVPTNTPQNKTTDKTSKKNLHTGPKVGAHNTRDVGCGDVKVNGDENCPTEDSGVRLSYAQVAQRKEKPPPPVAAAAASSPSTA